jgi:hypothetical protein
MYRVENLGARPMTWFYPYFYPKWFNLAVFVAHSSSGLGHRPLKAKITGSNPVCATNT